MELEVGRTKQIFTAHMAILLQSPRLRQQFAPRTPLRPIQIMDINPKMFGYILEYLYTHRMDFNLLEAGEGQPKALAQLYDGASQLGLDSLQQVIVFQLEMLPALKDNPTLVLELAEELYPKILKTDTFFKPFIIKALEQYKEGPVPYPEDYVEKLIAKGGDLAVDINKAERRRSSAMKAKEASMLSRPSYELLTNNQNCRASESGFV